MSLRGTLEKIRSGEDSAAVTAPSMTSVDDVLRSASGVRCIVIKDASIDLYKAVLNWLVTGFIAFPRHPPSDEPASDSVTSKTIYSLAHFLELEPLQELALLDHTSRLTLETIIPELLSDHSVTFTTWQNRIMRPVRQHWKKIKAGKHHLVIPTIVHEARSDEHKHKEMMEIVAGLIALGQRDACSEEKQ